MEQLCLFPTETSKRKVNEFDFEDEKFMTAKEKYKCIKNFKLILKEKSLKHMTSYMCQLPPR